MKKNILSMAVLLMASAAVFTACSSDDNIIDEQPAVTSQQTYTMTIEASKGGDGATTRALSIDDSGAKNVLNATWATTENVYVKKGDTWATGSLQPEAAGATATLKGSLSGIEINATDVLTLQFPKSGDISYDGQVGTLEDIAANFDYATATVTVASVSASGNIVPTAATTTFENQQAIVKFTLIDKADGTTPLSATQLVVNDGTTDYTITPASNTSVIYAAIPGFTGQTVTLTATVDEDTYTYEKASVSFTNGQYYEIAVKMTKQAAPAARTLAEATAEDLGKIAGADGNIYDTKDAAEAVATGNAVAMIAYVGSETGHATYTHGLAIALSDESRSNWSDAKTACEGKTAVSGAAWLLPSQNQWKAMFSANGVSDSSYSGLNTAITTAGGTALQENDYYWSSSSTESEDDYYADLVFLYFGDTYWAPEYKEGYVYRVRACLAF